MELSRRFLLSVPLAFLMRAAAAAEKIKVFRWVDIGGNAYLKRPPTPEDMLKAHATVVAAAEKQLPAWQRPSAEASRAFQEQVVFLTFNPHDSRKMVMSVLEGEEHLLMLGGKGRVYRYVVTVPSRWKRGRSRYYYRIVFIHKDNTVEEWRVYQGCANLTYARYLARGKLCIPHGLRVEVELVN